MLIYNQKHINSCDEAIFIHACGEPVRRKDLPIHEENYCKTYDPLVPCPYFNKGCTEKVLCHLNTNKYDQYCQIPRSQLKQHAEDFSDYHKMISECN